MKKRREREKKNRKNFELKRNAVCNKHKWNKQNKKKQIQTFFNK